MTDLATDADQTPHPLRAGELVGSRYRLKDIAGAGGMATVWLAYDERLQRPVAIKVISDALATSPTAVARFAREARTHAGIQHPNLVQVYDYSVKASRPYLVMEYVNGSTLSERLDQGGLAADAIQTLAAELLSAIACVHDHGVLHRDIKSGNVLIDGDGHSRLTDFGLARLEDSTQITRAHEVVGTLRFLAPELIEGKPASRQSDLYALGVLLRSAAGDTRLPAPLPKLISWLTQRDPKARPADAHAALDRLLGPQRRASAPQRRIRTEEPTQAFSRAGRLRYVDSAQLRNRTAAIAALLVAVLGTAFAVMDAGGSPAHAKSAPHTRPTSAHTRPAAHTKPTQHQAANAHAPTLDQQLQQLASSVRRAAKP